MRCAPTTAALLAAVLSVAAPRHALPAENGPYVIYGPDSRREVFGLRGARATAADSTVALVEATQIVGNGDGTSRLLTVPLAAQGLCRGERFRRHGSVVYRDVDEPPGLVSSPDQ